VNVQRRVRFREAFPDSAYRRLFLAKTTSHSGMPPTVALAIVVFQLTGSRLGTAGVLVAEIPPVLLLAPGPRGTKSTDCRDAR
jgi:hypothetical protein